MWGHALWPLELHSLIVTALASSWMSPPDHFLWRPNPDSHEHISEQLSPSQPGKVQVSTPKNLADTCKRGISKWSRLSNAFGMWGQLHSVYSGLRVLNITPERKKRYWNKIWKAFSGNKKKYCGKPNKNSVIWTNSL